MHTILSKNSAFGSVKVVAALCKMSPEGVIEGNWEGAWRLIPIQFQRIQLGQMMGSVLAIMLSTPCFKTPDAKKNEQLAQELRGLKPLSIKNFTSPAPPALAAHSRRHQSCDPRCA